MRIRQLRTDEEFNRYREGFAENFRRESSGGTAELPLDYLRASRAFGVFDDENRMVAGYTLGFAPNLRLLEFVPPAARATLAVPYGGTWEDCCEVTVAWKNAEVTSLFMASRFWPHALLGVLCSGKRFLLGHNQSARLDSLYTRLGPATLYAGPSTFGLPSRLFAYGRARIIGSLALLWAGMTPWRVIRKILGGRR